MPSERIFRRNSEDTLAACFALDIEGCKGLFPLQYLSVGLVITGLGFPVLERSQSATLPAVGSKSPSQVLFSNVLHTGTVRVL